MKFSIDGTMYELQGVGSNGLSLCSVQNMNGLLNHSEHLAALHFCSLHMVDLNGTEHSSMALKVETQPTKSIRQLLLQYSDVFSVPAALPRQRSCDHQIVLKGWDSTN